MAYDYATEKKLRPLYDAVDDCQYKVALQLANKYLKKSPNWALVKALKAVVLVRTGKNDEAQALCLEVKKAIPSDDATLQAITIAFKELGQNQQIVELYENVFNLQPKNEELGVQWFMAMVRNGDYKGQQQAAVKLQRIFKKDKYLFWSIMSLALQGQHGNALSYTLAERMMSKAQEENRLVEVEHMRLYLLIMLDQGKHEQALALLDTPLGQTALRDPEVGQIRVELLLKNGKWADAQQLCEQALRVNVDDWISWIAYFDAADGLLPDHPDAAASVRQWIATQQQADGAGVNRGPFLAELEWDHRERARAEFDANAALDHIIAYFARFGSKSCCFEDLKPYTAFLASDHTAAADLIKTLQATVPGGSHQVKNVYRAINVEKLKRYFGLLQAMDQQQQQDYADALWQQYQDALPLGVGLEKTEFQHGDDFVILAGHVLYDLFVATKQAVYVVQAIALLELALQKSIYNFQIKLLLVRLYLVLGTPSRAWAIYKTMDIKQIQYDTMIHYFSDRWLVVAQHDDLEIHLHEALSIYKSNEVETPDMQVQAYKMGTFSKIQEFNEFRARLDTSMQHAISKVDLIRMEALGSSFQAKYAVQFFQDVDLGFLKLHGEPTKRADNRDFKVMTSCNGASQPTSQELIKPAPSTNAQWLHLFTLILNLLNAASSTKNDASSLPDLVQALKTLLADEKALESKVTSQELAMAKYVLELSQALVLVKDKAGDKAVAHLQAASSILDAQSKQAVDENDVRVGWASFNDIYAVLETFNYGSVLLELVARTVGLTSKESRRKAMESDQDPLAHTVMQSLSSCKTALTRLQELCHKRAGYYKTAAKKLTQGAQLKAAASQECQAIMASIAKITVGDWQKSIHALMDEVDRRVLKLQ